MNTVAESAAVTVKEGKLKFNHHRVDYGLSWDQLVGVGLHYSWKHDLITPERFPITGEGVWEFEHRSFHFNDRITGSQVIEKMSKEDWIPADNVHILACRARRSKTGFPIVAMNPQGGSRVLSTKKNGRGYYLDIEPFNLNRVWPYGFHFLGIRLIGRIA